MAKSEDEESAKRIRVEESMHIDDGLPKETQNQESYSCSDCIRRVELGRTIAFQNNRKNYLANALTIMNSDTYIPATSFSNYDAHYKEYLELEEIMMHTEGELNSIPICHDENCEFNAALRANEELAKSLADATELGNDKNSEGNFIPSSRRKQNRNNKVKNPKIPAAQIETSNPYSVLSEVNANENQTEQSQTRTMPPINLKYTSEYENMLESVHKTCGNTTNKFGNDYIKIFTENLEQYNKVQSHLKQQGYDYYLVRPRDKKPLKVVVKGLPLEHNPERVKNYLTEIGFSVIRVTRLSQFRTRKPLPFLLIDLNNTPNAKDIYKIVKINRIDISFEEYRGRRQRGPREGATSARPNPPNTANSNDLSDFDISGLFEALRELRKLMTECPQLIIALREMKNKSEPIDKIGLLMLACSSSVNINKD
ncbi:hypothetical protein AVEN_149359-1 [Araneus ventricosus]|uniref:Pre-C2HC domain-containing protein n=1 Tax=Araneus ventricosus TaxID=182803 RepID=A0A4Y2R979_ARAVE|nr:hypothetical protein AVEN_149359-1 [Araneus ventricosus]